MQTVQSQPNSKQRYAEQEHAIQSERRKTEVESKQNKESSIGSYNKDAQNVRKLLFDSSAPYAFRYSSQSNSNRSNKQGKSIEELVSVTLLADC